MRRWVRFLGLAVMILSLAVPAVAAPSGGAVTLRVMSFNIFYGGDEVDLAAGDWCADPAGCQESLDAVIEAIRRSGADVVGLQEPDGNTAVIGERLGWYHHERTGVISRYPLIDPPTSDAHYVLVEVRPGRVVAMVNTHLPSDPYGPYLFRDGSTSAEVLANEAETRMPFLEERLDGIAEITGRGMPVFWVGDFNTPSHLDWTSATARAWGDPYTAFAWPVSKAVMAAGFRDSYRTVHRNPVTAPGYTWTPGGLESAEDEVHDRIDWVLYSGPARPTASQIVGEPGGPDVDIAVDPFTSDHRGVVSTFRVEPLPLPTMAAVGDRRLTEGESVPIRFRAPANARLALVPSGGGLADAVAGRSVTGLGRTRLTPPTAGAYEVVLFTKAGRELSRAGVWVYREDAPIEVSVGAESYAVGGTIEVSWTNAPGMQWDWLGVFEAGQDIPPEAYSCKATGCGGYDYLLYDYTGTRIEGSRGIVADLEPGTYEIRFMSDDGYLLYAVSDPFTVVDG